MHEYRRMKGDRLEQAYYIERVVAVCLDIARYLYAYTRCYGFKTQAL